MIGPYAQKYLEKIGDLIPMYQIMSNDVFLDKFDGDAEEVYKYCVEHFITWQKVLGIGKEDNPDIVY